ncbi:hypothetical protein NPIL_408161 [Nephila pilipes]|uniref:Uncharacterized protein n=1 Tax=Nephila pilipes TaxID=299642 RepID=A0A8X6QMI0_NEPPI|nr:hypothetical protein NPIL_408161 [Nephila pilipes]
MRNSISPQADRGCMRWLALPCLCAASPRCIAPRTWPALARRRLQQRRLPLRNHRVAAAQRTAAAAALAIRATTLNGKAKGVTCHAPAAPAKRQPAARLRAGP